MAWIQWCNTSAATAATDTAWTAWIDDATSTATSTATVVWRTWTAISTASSTAAYVQYQPPKLTKGQAEALQAERAARAERERIESEKRRQEQEAADRRAEELLLANLTKGQTDQYRKEKKIVVRSKDGADFELASLWSGNAVEMTPDGKRIARFCIHPNTPVPIPDLLLAQKLMLETDPDSFRKIANRTPLGAP